MEDSQPLTLAEKPPRLSAECIRSLLQQSLKLARVNPKIFLKALFASNAFLKTARRYPVYTFIVEPGFYGKFFVSFGNEMDLSTFKNIRDLEKTERLHARYYEHTFELMKLLDPVNFYVNLEYGQKSNEVFGQYEILFSLVRNGKIGSILSKWNGASAYLNRFAPYLNILECHFDVLKNADVVSTLKLNYLVIDSILDKEKFNALLRYNVGKMTLNHIEIVDGGAITEMEKLRANSVLENLNVKKFTGSCESLIEVFNLLKRHCQKLHSFDVSFVFYDAVLCPKVATIRMDEVLKKLPKIHEKLKAFSDHEAAKSFSSLVVRTSSIFRVPKNFTLDQRWPEELKDFYGFKKIVYHNYNFSEVEFKSEYGYFTLIHHVNIH